MLPGWIAGHYTGEECRIDLIRLTRYAQWTLDPVGVQGYRSAGARACSARDGTTLPYDVVSLDTGTRSPVFDIPGAARMRCP